MTRYTQDSSSIAEEVGRLTLAHREHIVIEVEILLVEPLDAMQVHLDWVTIKSWKILGRNDILVENNVYLVAIYPLGHLTFVRYHKVNLANKRHILGYSAKEVAQSAPVAKTLLQHGLVGILLVVALPHWVQAIYVCNNYIHFRNVLTVEPTPPLQR